MKYCCFLILVLLSQLTFAQITRPKFQAAAAYDTSLNISAELGDIRVSVDKFSGRYSIEHGDGTPILFTRNGFATSYTNVRMGYFTYTNNTLYAPQTPEGTRSMPTGSARIQNNSIIFQTTINSQIGTVDLEQTFTPTIEPNFNFVRIKTKLTNTSPLSIPLGALLVMDLMAGGSDYAEVLINGMTVDVETGYKSSAVPKDVLIRSNYTLHKIKCRLDGTGIIKPDQFVVGRWQYNGYLGAVNWNYIPSGLRFGDNAMMMQWDQVMIPSGSDFIVTTDYGLEENKLKTDANINCYVSPTIWNDSLQSYQPNPFDVRARVTNTGTSSLSGLVLVLGPLLNGLSLAAGENATKSIPGTLLPNASADVIWKIESPVFEADTIVQIPIRIAQPPTVADTCIGQTTIPAAHINHTWIAELFCGTPVTLQKDNIGAGYEPNPFLIEPIITNIGTEYLDSLLATIVLPPRLTLISGKQTQLLNPFPLIPGSLVKPTWVVVAAPAFTADSVEYLIRVQNKQGILIECKQKVYLPAVDIVNDCTENGPSTRGKEFWLSFGRDDHPYSPELSLFIAAEKSCDVRIEIPLFRLTIISHIFDKNIIQFPIDRRIADISPPSSDRCVYVSATEPVSVAISRSSSNISEATGVLPINALGTAYTLLGYPQGVFISATEDGTQINGNAQQYRRGELTTVSGKIGDSLTSNKPINVISSVDRLVNFLGTPGKDGNTLIETLPPNNLFGREYVVVPALTRFGGDYVQIATDDDGNVVRINNLPRALPKRGDNIGLLITTPTYISADKPVVVMQFTMPTFFDKPMDATPYADASMVCLTPIDRFSTCHSFTTFVANHFNFTAVTLIVHDGGQKLVSLDGRLLPDTVFKPLMNAPFRYARFPVVKGTHRVGTLDQRGVGVIVYGFSLYDGYSYNSGYLITKKTPIATDINDESLPNTFELKQNYPNPFGGGSETKSPATNIVIRTKGGAATLKVYDMLGREITTLLDRTLESGEHTIVFDDHSANGALPSGVYYYRLEMNERSEMKKMVIMR